MTAYRNSNTPGLGAINPWDKKRLSLTFSGIMNADVAGIEPLSRMREAGARLIMALPPKSQDLLSSHPWVSKWQRRSGISPRRHSDAPVSLDSQSTESGTVDSAGGQGHPEDDVAWRHGATLEIGYRDEPFSQDVG